MALIRTNQPTVNDLLALDLAIIIEATQMGYGEGIEKVARIEENVIGLALNNGMRFRITVESLAGAVVIPDEI